MDNRFNKYYIDAQPYSPEPPACKAPVRFEAKADEAAVVSAHGASILGVHAASASVPNIGAHSARATVAETSTTKNAVHMAAKDMAAPHWPSGKSWIRAPFSRMRSLAAALIEGCKSPESRPKLLQAAAVTLVVLLMLTLPLAYILQDVLSKPEQTAATEETPPNQQQPTFLDNSSQPDLDTPDVSTPAQEEVPEQRGYYSYQQDGASAGPIGIDVSEHQGDIDWQAVANNGISFAFVRIGNRGYTAGDISLDKYFRSNIQEAKDAGLEVGVYFFSQAITDAEAREEADFVLKELNGRDLELPVVYDFEPVVDEGGRANGLSGQQRSRNAKVFCERIEAGGYTAMLYGNATDISYYTYDSNLFTTYDIWIASYSSEPPTAPFNFSIWQFASNGVIPGITTFVDLNLRFDPGKGPVLPPNVIFHSG